MGDRNWASSTKELGERAQHQAKQAQLPGLGQADEGFC
jgi:hypothetical protein